MHKFKTNRRTAASFVTNREQILLLAGVLVSVVISACGSSSAPGGQPGGGAPPPPELPVIAVATAPATTYRDYSASLEGKVNVEIRPQVEGLLEKIYVDEGAWVKAGQPLFKIDDRIYAEQVTNAKSSVIAAQANAARAKVEVDRLVPLVQNNVISDVQLKTAQANYDAQLAAVEQAKAVLGNAQINAGYTLVKAPVSGYIGRIPYKLGSLVGKNESQPLTVLSDISQMYAYFSMSEPDFIAFKNQFKGNTLQDKLKAVGSVELIQPDNTPFPQKGKISTVEGQFNKTQGAITFRATFPNPGNILRSGSTGRVRIPTTFPSALIIPQVATYEIQDKVFVYVVGDSNKVSGRPINVSGKTNSYYFVENGLKPGEKIVYSGAGSLQEGAAIVPKLISTDSLLKANPL